MSTTQQSLPNFPGEVVTHAFVREVRVPGLTRPAALITLDNGLDHTKPNSFGPAGLANLEAAIDAAIAAEPAFIAVTGKPYIFCVGADVTGMPLIKDHDQAMAIGSYGHKVFAKFKDSPVPTFAFVNGAALGGGLELALHCHYRTLSRGVAALGLPEVSLGLIPGWGGSQLLPNLIGIINAAQVIVQNPLMQNKMLRPAQAHEMGISDALFDPADFLEHSLEWAAAVVQKKTTVEREPVDRSEMWDAIVGFARQQLDERLHGAPLAPVQGAGPARHGEDRAVRRGHGGRGRGAGRPGHGRRVPQWTLRLRPGAAAGQAAGRRARQGPRACR